MEYISNCEIAVETVLKMELNISKKLITRLKKGNYIKVNGQDVTVKYVMKKGDVLTVELPQDNSDGIEEGDVLPQVLYEDDSILAVIKPTKMPVHPSRGNQKNTLANAVMHYYSKKPFVYRCITRLDTNTSGIVLIAKDAYAAANTKVTKKLYTAHLSKTPTEESGIIDAPIAREKEGNIKRCVRNDGKKAITHYKIIEKIGDECLARIYTETGRTHQIRVHMAHIGCPLKNDFLYSDAASNEPYMLCCDEIEFIHPKTHLKVSLIFNKNENLVANCNKNE